MVCWSLFPPARNGPAEYQMRAEHLSAFDPASPALEHVGISAHVTNACHPVGDVERINHFFIPHRRDEGAVNVHVPESGDHVFAIGIDDLSFPPLGDEAHFAHSCDSVLGDDDCHPLFNSTVCVYLPR